MTLPTTMSEIEHAAVIVMLFGEDEAAGVLSLLEPEELHLVGEAMCRLGEVGPERIAMSVESFIRNAAHEALPAQGRPEQVRTLMSRAVGEAKATHLMERIAPATQSRSLEIARWLAPQSLLVLIEDEHPQAVAVLLLLLDAAPAATLLAQLPVTIQPVVVERIARLGKVSAQAVLMLDALLTRRIGERFGQAVLTMGGAREAAELINKAAGEVEKQVMPALVAKDEGLARAIELELFTFTMLLKLDAQSIGRLLRDVENDVLVDALKGLDSQDREPFFAAMSSRAADGVRDEIELRGRLRRADFEAAQRSMIATARKLAEAGEIQLGAGDGDYV
jgi:flagellar motor switch protein FliG